MDFIQRNVFRELRSQFFNTEEQLEPMTNYKQKKLREFLKNINDAPAGDVALANPILNHRLQAIQVNERHAIDTSVETIELLRIIVSNMNRTLNGGLPINGIIQLGLYLRTKGDKVDFVKLDTWLDNLHIRRMAQLQGSVLIHFFQFVPEEIPFVIRQERGAYQLTLRSLHYTARDYEEKLHFQQSQVGFVKTNSAVLRRNLRRSFRYFDYAPIEAASNFLHNFARSLSEIEE